MSFDTQTLEHKHCHASNHELKSCCVVLQSDQPHSTRMMHRGNPNLSPAALKAVLMLLHTELLHVGFMARYIGTHNPALVLPCVAVRPTTQHQDKASWSPQFEPSSTGKQCTGKAVLLFL